MLEQDAANLLIISTDDERLGSHEQLRSLGRLLGVRVETVIGRGSLAARIAALPGPLHPDRYARASAGRDTERGRASTARCASAARACTMMLVLPASAQSGVIDDAVAQLRRRGVRAAAR